jgi:hypothetical protein
MKEVQANALQVANKFTSRTRVIEDSDVDADFEEVVFELAEEEALLEELGMRYRSRRRQSNTRASYYARGRRRSTRG